MADIIAIAEHKKRVHFRVRIQLIALIAAVVAGAALAINASANLNSAVLGGIGLAGLGVAVIAYVWSLVYGMIIVAKNPGPPNLR